MAVTPSLSWLEINGSRATPADLNAAFRSGKVPDPPPRGRYAGVLLSLQVAPGLDQVSRFLASRWMPWVGKTFDPNTESGDNVFTRDSLVLAHVLWPTFHGYQSDLPTTYRAFPFRTRVGRGLFDTDQPVLKLDYDLPGNPRMTVRRLLDELVQVREGNYLGRAHARWWWGRWQTVGFFALAPEANPPGD